MKVTSVESQKKSIRQSSGPKRFNVYLDGKFAFGADEDLVVNFRLIKGKELSPTDLEKLLFEAEVGKLMDRIYGLLGRRARSEKEIRDYLKTLSFKRKVRDKEFAGISDVVIDSLISKLKLRGLISDEQFARAWVESRRKSKKKGAIALKQELYQKGIDKEIIEEVINKQVTGDSEEDLALQALEKKLKSWQNLGPLELKKKAYEFLMRRGFEYSVIQDVVAKFLQKD